MVGCGGSCHPRGHGEWPRSATGIVGRMQNKAQLVVHQVSACDPEPLTPTRMEAVSDDDLSVESLVGSMSDLRSRP